jgi:hypothetical protein
MSEARERAIEALLKRRGLAALFGRPEAESDVQAIEAVVDLVDRDAGCARCQTLDEALNSEGARIYRAAEGGLLVVTPEADPDEVVRRLAEDNAVELVEKPGHAEAPAATCTSVLVRDVFECRLDAGHDERHECPGTGGARVRWTDTEAGAG